jgi:hypothetical protein
MYQITEPIVGISQTQRGNPPVATKKSAKTPKRSNGTTEAIAMTTKKLKIAA